MSQQIWKQFISGDSTTLERLPSKVAISWKNCYQNNIDPFKTKPGKILPARVLSSKQKENQLLIRLVKEEIQRFDSYLKLRLPLFILTDESGNILWRDGNYQVKDYANQIRFAEGSNWTELEVGTNAIGITLNTKEVESVAIFEHYSAASRNWSCLAAPIFDEDRNILGVLDISTYQNESATAEATFLNLIASQVSNQIIKKRLEKKKELLQFVTTYQGQEIICDEQFRVMHVSKELEKQFPFDQDIRNQLNSKIIYKKEKIHYNSQVIGYKFAIFSKEATSKTFYYPGVPSQNEEYQSFLKQVEQVASSALPIHIFGESGSGKEIIAQTIHYNSPVSKGPLVSVNCGAISENLLESELFGYAAGAFTGADVKGHLGQIEQANGGTLFLDEIDSMPKKMQSALLRVLEEKVVVPLNGQPKKVHFRLVTASNQEIRQLVQNHDFREDLFYRIYVCPLRIPALRERKEDIEQLTQMFCEKKKWQVPWTPKVIAVAKMFSWPGNIREYNNFLERLAVLYPQKEPTKQQIKLLIETGSIASLKIEKQEPDQQEFDKIVAVLEKNQYQLTKTAEELDISRTTLYRKMKKYHLKIK